MRKFTNSATFDVNYLFEKTPKRHKKENKEHKFDEPVFDVKNMFEK